LVVGDEGDFLDNLLEDEEWEIYYNRAQLNKHVRDRHMWGPHEV
jgi:hypothetical protein